MPTIRDRDTHKCPAPPCNRQVDRSRLACRNHWYAIPKHLRDQIWDAYLSGADEHTALVAEAVQYLHERYPA
jgi:hypothetical protein